jgi:uncharacterized membrane protein YdjX (TVP38/TMEM64 family)
VRGEKMKETGNWVKRFRKATPSLSLLLTSLVAIASAVPSTLITTGVG